METEKPSKRYQSTKLHSIAAQKPVTSDWRLTYLMR
jgi:hypothetical protein